MAQNLISYNRFTALPQNISAYGATAEEFAIARGNPDADPRIAPMASPQKAESALALGKTGSDKIRFSRPQETNVNPYEGPQSTLSLSRRAANKLGSAIIGQLESVVESGTVAQGQLQGQMGHSLQRVRGLADFLSYQNQLTDTIYARTLSVSKG